MNLKIECRSYFLIGEFPSYGATQDSCTDLPDLSKTFNPYGISGTSWTIILMLVSSLPNALVATQVKSAESERSVRLMLKSESTPWGKISSLIVYRVSPFGSRRLLLMFQRMPIGFSPLASHCSTAGSPRRDVWLRSLISNWGGAKSQIIPLEIVQNIYPI